MRAALIYPHQLFEKHPALANCETVFLIEDPLYFRQYPFHQQKLILHRASMKQYAVTLAKNYTVHYVDSNDITNSGDIVALAKTHGVTSLSMVDPSDDWLQKKLNAACEQQHVPLQIQDDPHFLTHDSDWQKFVGNKKKLFFTDFYVQQRQRLNILIESDGKPVGERWTFDTENRKKLPKGIRIPSAWKPKLHPAVEEAQHYVQENFSHHIGSSTSFQYPITRKEALQNLQHFLDHRFYDFGIYEDAIAKAESVLFHSVLTPSLNIGLISPQEIIDAALSHRDEIPLNSMEGFIRQIIGWREYMRGVYRTLGVQQRTRNFWNHTRAMPHSFYDGTTGIEPVDTVIHRVLQTGYCHHIERLMILGNFLVLCEIHPDAIYQWFMELFIDAYDWVMVPNVYGMSIHADGGYITTKPYISGSSYVLKMSDYKKSTWCPIWDGLYWRFIDNNREFFAKNPRMSMMVAQCNKMGDKLQEHHRVADAFLQQLK